MDTINSTASLRYSLLWTAQLAQEYIFDYQEQSLRVPTYSSCREEIETLHEFFVAWYAGERGEGEFERMELALGPAFEMVTPDGVRHDRSAVLEGVRESHGRDEPDEFDIEIRNVELIEEMGPYAVVRYEEWQSTATETTGRISTVVFRDAPDAPGGLRWLDLHETWLEQ